MEINRIYSQKFAFEEEMKLFNAKVNGAYVMYCVRKCLLLSKLFLLFNVSKILVFSTL